VAEHRLDGDGFVPTTRIDASGDRIAVSGEQDDIVLWDLIPSGPLLSEITVPRLDSLLQLDDGKIVVVAGSAESTTDRGIQVWDRAGRRWAHVPSLASSATVSAVDGRTLHLYEWDWSQSISLDPEVWVRRLCQAGGRDYTEQELANLPDGADPTPPCATGG
jgi:hypothetical protein